MGECSVTFFSPAPKDPPRERRKPARIKRSPIKRLNPRRRKSEFARCYHSKERVAFVKSLPCVGCGFDPRTNIYGACENAHIETGGTSRKSDYTKVVPLCAPHPVGGRIGRLVVFRSEEGCHRDLHHLGRESFEAKYKVNLEKAAAETEKRWLDFSSSEQGKP